ncbi:cell division protein FtsQ/DivIB [[Clostridium] aminophilum]|uniref:cell division protein FtsQ/DivIB n=1 Tax=[Clostridium] aminophilum TaxID=1526 RepID=UPI003F9B890A
MDEKKRFQAFRTEEPKIIRFQQALKRKKKYTVWIAAAVGGLVLVVLLLCVQIREVKVSGNRHYSQEEIEEKVFREPFARSSLLTFFRNRFRPHEKIPFIEDYRIAFRSPVSCEIIVYEKSIVGYVSYMSSNLYFDKDGVVVESTSDIYEGAPQVTGLHFGHIVLGKALPVDNPEIFRQILNLTQKLATSNIVPDKISYDDKMNATLFIRDLLVKLGGSESMDRKLTELADIVSDYPDLSGTLYLDSFDSSNSNPMYRFEKK